MIQLQSFLTTVGKGPRGALLIVLPFEPDAEWGAKTRHLIGASIGANTWRGVVETIDHVPCLRLAGAWLRDNPLEAGDTVQVTVWPEGPQLADLDPDVAAALAAAPDAGDYFDGLAQFYRKGYLTWIAATKRRPDERARRIAETVALLKAGKKERPR